jgi:hypothetical protein
MKQNENLVGLDVNTEDTAWVYSKPSNKEIIYLLTVLILVLYTKNHEMRCILKMYQMREVNDLTISLIRIWSIIQA